MTMLTEEINELIHQLRDIEHRIVELTGGSVDTVIDENGRPFMLSQAQHELHKRAEIHRQYAEQQSSILNAIPAHIALLDGEGKLVEVNDAWRGFGQANENTDPLFGVGENYLKICENAFGDDYEDASLAAQGIRDVLLGNKRYFSMEYPCHSPTKQRWFRMMVATINTDDRHGAVVMHLDITERKIADIEMQRALSVFKSSNDGILILNDDSIVVDSNPAYSRITGYEKDQLLGEKVRFVLPELQTDGLENFINQSLVTQGFWRGEVRARRQSDEVYHQNISISVVYDDLGFISNYIVIISDITDTKTHEAELEHVAHHDALTGLPNRRLLTDRIQQAMTRAKRNQDLMALCYIDLDHFKPINDSMGHDAGDQVLVTTSARLVEALRESDTISRIGGDEFILLLPSLKHENELRTLVRRLLKIINKPITIYGKSIKVEASMGIVLFPGDGSDADTLIRHADQAMYQAKESGRNQYHLYDSKIAREIESRNSFIDEVKKGLLNKEFVLFYQPKVNLRDGTIVGFEALVRWQHPTKGLLSPAQFLPAVIGSNIETVFGEYVMQSAIEQLATWQSQGQTLCVSVNVSGNELRQPNLFKNISKQLKRFPQIEGKQLEIEVLETATLQDLAQVISMLNQCRDAGIRVSLDDFGTGYSSLTVFRRLPVDILKIDQSFVRNLLTDHGDQSIVESVISMGKAFERDVVAEGVETLSHASRLVELGCELGQGYGIARPMPASEVLDWIAQSESVDSYLQQNP